jgi:hypothetical protein
VELLTSRQTGIFLSLRTDVQVGTVGPSSRGLHLDLVLKSLLVMFLFIDLQLLQRQHSTEVETLLITRTFSGLNLGRRPEKTR